MEVPVDELLPVIAQRNRARNFPSHCPWSEGFELGQNLLKAPNFPLNQGSLVCSLIVPRAVSLVVLQVANDSDQYRVKFELLLDQV